MIKITKSGCLENFQFSFAKINGMLFLSWTMIYDNMVCWYLPKFILDIIIYINIYSNFAKNSEVSLPKG